jgi:hypothetical protein
MTIDTENPADLIPRSLTPDEIDDGVLVRRTGILRTPQPERPVVDDSLRARIERTFLNTFGATTVVTELLDRLEVAEARIAQIVERMDDIDAGLLLVSRELEGHLAAQPVAAEL